MRPFLVLVATACLGLPGIGFAAGGAGTSREDRASELLHIQEKVDSLRAEMTAAASAKSSAEAELLKLDLRLDLQLQLMEQARVERLIAQEEAARTAAEVEALEVDTERLKREFRRRLARLYRVTPVDWLQAFVSVRSPHDLFAYVRTLRRVGRRDARLFVAYRENRTRLTAELIQRTQVDEKLARTLDLEQDRLISLRNARRKQGLVAKALGRERERLTRRGDELDEKEEKLALLIAALAGQLDRPLSGTPIQTFRGVLDWPLDGEIEVPFGPRVDARYRTLVPHNGVRIGVVQRTEVRSVFPGMVIFASDFEGFGLTVVVHHPGRVFSLYAGLADLKVGAQDVVTLNQALGDVEDEAYFEIRVENRPEDPTEWLR